MSSSVDDHENQTSTPALTPPKVPCSQPAWTRRRASFHRQRRGRGQAARRQDPGTQSARRQRLVFISGQGPRDFNADMETQFRQTFERIKLILEQAGGSMKNIVILRAYFVHFSRDLAVYRKVRKEYLVQPYPASTAVGVTELAPPGNQIEIEAVAVL
jgi:enamine deaminase RidA (YjgF/YER057c/UK114 family)